jgi:hypothetical protein
VSGQYTVVGVSATEALTASTLNTFSTSIAVQGGDIIGSLTPDGGNCVDTTGVGGDAFGFQFTTPTVGQVLTVSNGSGFLLDIAATLAPAGSTFVPQVNHVFLCYSKFEQDGGAVFDVSQQAALIKQGYWLPSAVAGSIAGGDNIGAYHLVCNPPTGLAATNLSLDDGGDVLSNTVAAEGTGYYPILG